MRKPSFFRLVFEELEKRDMLNMIFGQLGTPGSALVNWDNPASEALTASSPVMQNWNERKADGFLLAQTEEPSHHVAQLAVAGAEQSQTPATSSNGNQDSVPALKSDAGFNVLWETSFDFGFVTGNGASLVLPGGGDVNPTVPKTTAGFEAGSGSSVPRSASIGQGSDFASGSPAIHASSPAYSLSGSFLDGAAPSGATAGQGTLLNPPSQLDVIHPGALSPRASPTPVGRSPKPLAPNTGIWPLTAGSHQMLQGFGDGSPQSTYKFHEGIDILASGNGGEDVQVSRAGKVVYLNANQDGTQGNGQVTLEITIGAQKEYDTYLQSTRLIPGWF
jgi:hypothetical protein